MSRWCSSPRLLLSVLLLVAPRLADFVGVRLLGCASECVERVRPELVEVLADGGEPLPVELVDAARSLGVIGYEARVLEHLEVLRDRWAADGERAGDVDHGERTAREAAEDGASHGVAQGGQLGTCL